MLRSSADTLGGSHLFVLASDRRGRGNLVVRYKIAPLLRSSL